MLGEQLVLSHHALGHVVLFSFCFIVYGYITFNCYLNCCVYTAVQSHWQFLFDSSSYFKKKQHNAKQPLCQLDSQLKRSSINISEPWKLAHKQTLWIGGSSMRHISHYWLSWLKKYLCIPATSAPSEQAFSTSGNTVICQRSALKPERVDQLVFLALNL